MIGHRCFKKNKPAFSNDRAYSVFMKTMDLWNCINGGETWTCLFNGPFHHCSDCFLSGLVCPCCWVPQDCSLWCHASSPVSSSLYECVSIHFTEIWTVVTQHWPLVRTDRKYWHDVAIDQPWPSLFPNSQLTEQAADTQNVIAPSLRSHTSLFIQQTASAVILLRLQTQPPVYPCIF